MIVLFYICYILAFIPCLILYPIKMIGKNNIKKLKGKNYIVSCNHMSNNDSIVLDFKLHKKLYFLAKIELFKNKFKAGLLKFFGAIPIDRNSVDTSSIKKVFKLLAKKKSICIFPQGTRAKQPQITDGEAKEGVAMFSIRTNTPVLPMAFNKKVKIFRRSKLLIGEPIYPDIERKKDKEYLKEFTEIIINATNKLLEGDKQ